MSITIDGSIITHIINFHANNKFPACDKLHDKLFIYNLIYLIKNYPNNFPCYNCESTNSIACNCQSSRCIRNEKALPDDLSLEEKNFINGTINSMGGQDFLPIKSLGEYMNSYTDLSILKMNELLKTYFTFTGFINLKNLCANCMQINDKKIEQAHQNFMNEHSGGLSGFKDALPAI